MTASCSLHLEKTKVGCYNRFPIFFDKLCGALVSKSSSKNNTGNIKRTATTLWVLVEPLKMLEIDRNDYRLGPILRSCRPESLDR